VWIEPTFKEGKVALRFGQFKGPFNRQELVSDFASEFPERAITAKFVDGGRDMGLMLHNNFDKSPEGLEWAVGVFNSFVGGKDEVEVSCPIDSEKCPLPAGGVKDWEPAVFVRLGWNSGKIKGYSEADLEGGPLRYGVGVSYKVGLGQLNKGKEESLGDNMPHAVGADLLLKVQGFDLMVGAFFTKRVKADTGTKASGFGAHVQAGYFLVPKKWQVAARFAMVPNAKYDKDDEAKDELTDIEARGAVNYYFKGHQWKWSTDFGVVQTTGADSKDDANIEVRSLMQLTF
jgi:hypothetical protein